MSIITLPDIRDSAVNRMKAVFEPDKQLVIAAHPGIFDEAEIRAQANRTPAILTSLMKVSGEDETTCDFVSWVLYRANNKDRLYDGALKLVSALIPVIRNLDAEWCIGGGRNIEAECLYSSSKDQLNIPLWAVKWRWSLRGLVLEGDGGGILLPEGLDYFEGYDAAHLMGTQEIKDEVYLEVSDDHTDDANP